MAETSASLETPLAVAPGIDAGLNKNPIAYSRLTWVVGLWLLSVGVATIAWVAGLAWATIWLFERTWS